MSQVVEGPVAAADQFALAARISVTRMRTLTDADWSVPAATLEWSCWQTIDHLVDCLFSYAFQLAAQKEGDWLPIGELHVRDGTTPDDLLESLEAVSRIFVAVLAAAPPTARASDGVVLLDSNDWAALGTYEILLHTHDVCGGLSGLFEPPRSLCVWMLGSTGLWMVDRQQALLGRSPWEQALLGSGRHVSSGGDGTFPPSP
jgi:hypothetical protein